MIAGKAVVDLSTVYDTVNNGILTHPHKRYKEESTQMENIHPIYLCVKLHRTLSYKQHVRLEKFLS